MKPNGNPENSSRLAITVAFVAAAGIALHLSLRFLGGQTTRLANIPLYVALAVGGIPLVVQLAKKLWSGDFGSDFLAGVSIVTGILLREYLVATIVVLMLSGGTALEVFASRRASRVLDALARRMPSTAHRQAGQGLVEIPAAEIAVGDALVILPHEICPVDGIVIEGQGSMNEAYLTGEPFEVEKAPGAAVLSGAVNGESLLTIRAEKLATDSRYARIMRVMEETQQRRPRMRRLGDRLGAWYTPLAIGIAVLAWLLSGQVERFLAVLVIATPCPLLIAIPSCRDRRNLAFSSTRHHHQKSRRAGTNRFLQDLSFRQNRNAYLRQARPHPNGLRRRLFPKRSSVSRSQSRTILEASVGCSHSRLSPPARLSPFASFARQRSAG